jgi:hypothetical protein
MPDQNEKRQLDGQVLDRVVTGKASGRDTSRPELIELLRLVRDRGAVVVDSMDRLARNPDDLCALVQTPDPQGMRVEFVKEQLLFTGEDSPWLTPALGHGRVPCGPKSEPRQLDASRLSASLLDDFEDFNSVAGINRRGTPGL